MRLFTDIGKGGDARAGGGAGAGANCKAAAVLEQRLLRFTHDFQQQHGRRPRSVTELPASAVEDYAAFKEHRLQMRGLQMHLPARGKEN